MARPLRIDMEGGYYHVTSRGVARQEVFFNDEDRETFLTKVAESHERWGVVFHGYCLMGNHVHLEVETPRGNLSRVMQWVFQNHAAHVNRKHDRVGHLFQGRFKSALVEGETYLHHLTRYIHLNPVRAGLVDRPAKYRWSSYRVYLCLERCPKWLEISPTLRQFGRTRREQIAKYREFVESEMPEDPLREMVYGALLGTQEFVELVRERLARRKPTGEVARLREALPRRDLHFICQAVAEVYQTSDEDLRVRGRKLNRARDVVIYLARQHAGLPLTELGNHLGGIGGPAVSLAYRRVAEQIVHDRRLRRQVEQLQKKLAGTKMKIND